jgi:CheY-like chemotaxis protein
MAKLGPIILVEDDLDDKSIFEEALRDIGVKNEIRWFETPIAAFADLKTTDEHPMLIFCDINLPKQNGLEFKANIDSDPELRKKSIPFVFYSTSASQETVNEAYLKLTVQGFFKKEHSYDKIKDMLKLITDYWRICIHPNSG